MRIDELRDLIKAKVRAELIRRGFQEPQSSPVTLVARPGEPLPATETLDPEIQAIFDPSGR